VIAGAETCFGNAVGRVCGRGGHFVVW
jgi:hypothetical protein